MSAAPGTTPRRPRLALRSRIQDWSMGLMNEHRPAALAPAHGDVLEVGFGTGLNLDFYPRDVRSLTAVDPLDALHDEVLRRISAAAFPVERFALRADGELPFDAGRFDCVVTTWTLCSIPQPGLALAEMRRVLRPGGAYLFVEHGRSPEARVARWQDRLNPVWRRLAEGCNMNRAIDRLVEDAGFALEGVERFRGRGPRVLAELLRGVARRA